jgi:hypothetical protein
MRHFGTIAVYERHEAFRSIGEKLKLIYMQRLGEALQQKGIEPVSKGRT